MADTNATASLTTNPKPPPKKPTLYTSANRTLARNDGKSASAHSPRNVGSSVASIAETKLSCPTKKSMAILKKPTLYTSANRTLARNAGKSASAHSPRNVGSSVASIAETKLSCPTKKSMAISDADILTAQKKVERLIGRNELMKKKLENSKEEVRMKKEQSKNNINDLKLKIKLTKDRTIETIQETEVLELRGNILEDELKQNTQELEENRRKQEEEETALESRLVKDKTEMIKLSKMMVAIYRMTGELAQVMMGRLVREKQACLAWRAYSWLKSFWSKEAVQLDSVGKMVGRLEVDENT